MKFYKQFSLVVLLFTFLFFISCKKNIDVKVVPENSANNTTNKLTDVMDSTTPTITPEVIIDYGKFIGWWKPNKTNLDTALRIDSYDGILISGEFFSVYGQGDKLPQAKFECSLENNKGLFRITDTFSNDLRGEIEINNESIIVNLKIIKMESSPIEDGDFIFFKDDSIEYVVPF